MSSNLHLVIQETLSSDETRALGEILEGHNFEQTAQARAPLAITLRDDAGQIVGGVCGTMAWGLLYIQTLVVEARFRGQGYGAQLLIAAEREAVARGCHLAHLHTMSFQAPAFYERHGYHVFQVFEGSPAHYKRYLLQKRLFGAQEL